VRAGDGRRQARQRGPADAAVRASVIEPAVRGRQPPSGCRPLAGVDAHVLGRCGAESLEARSVSEGPPRITVCVGTFPLLHEPVWIVLLVEHVIDRGGQVRLPVNPANAASFRPPITPPFFVWNPQIRLLLIESPRAPGLELRANDFRMRRRPEHYVHMIGAAIDRMQGPSSVVACLGHLLVNTLALVRSQRAGVLRHPARTFEFQNRVR
jgi:hypothetical protein